MTLSVPMIFAVLLGLLLVGAAAQDALRYTISNRWVLAIIVLFLPYAWFGDIGWGVGWHVLHFAVALVVGMGLFAMKWFGGGDAKLYAALALWFPISAAPQLLVAVAFAGFFELLFYIVGVRLALISGRAVAQMKDRRIPYGVAIAAGGIIMLATMGLSQA